MGVHVVHDFVIFILVLVQLLLLYQDLEVACHLHDGCLAIREHLGSVLLILVFCVIVLFCVLCPAFSVFGLHIRRLRFSLTFIPTCIVLVRFK